MTRPRRRPRLVGARLLPAELRVWAEALWAEAGEVHSAFGRLTWLAGGVWLIARESVMIRRVRHAALFGACTALVACTAWSQASSFDAGVVWYLVATTVLVLAGLPRLVRRRFGPVTDSRVARGLRMAAYAAFFMLIVALVAMLRSDGGPGQHTPALAAFVAWSVFLLILVGYVALVLMVTAQGSRVAPAALAIATGSGLALGAAMYAIMPLGVSNDATAPWLLGSAIDPLVAIAWVLLLGGPVTAAVLAGWCYRCAEAPMSATHGKIRQSVAAGTLATTVGSVVVSVLGPVTIALLPRSGALARVLYPGQHLTATAIAGRAHEFASNGAPFYFLIWLLFPLIGLGLGSWTGLIAWHHGRAARPGHGPGGGGADDRDGPSPLPGGYAGDLTEGQASVAAGAFVRARSW
jgi:hypothetical protein